MKHLTNWLPTYIARSLFSPTPVVSGTTHVLFLFVDHYELAGKAPRLSEWMEKYPRLAARHRDADGLPPKHSWFYALDLLREDELAELKGLVQSGLGEMELHWHHAHDTEASFSTKLSDGLAVFQKYGFMRAVRKDQQGCFGFIHGNWSLNNACGDQRCGVDNEIALLSAAGCYGDFTFPALHCVAQPSTVNAIYYATFARGRSGYSRGRLAEVGRQPERDEFLMFQGPLVVNWRDWRFKWHPMIENGEVGQSCTHGDPARIDAWIRGGIHVKGRPDWLFVKVFCHGGQDHSSVLGEETDRMFSYLEEKYNDGKQYKLHYVTSREAYNLVKAAEDGKSGDPHQYRDYVIPHPLER